jgi:hypothetical protein
MCRITRVAPAVQLFTPVSRITGITAGIQVVVIQTTTADITPRQGAPQSGVGWTVGMNLIAVARRQ